MDDVARVTVQYKRCDPGVVGITESLGEFLFLVDMEFGVRVIQGLINLF